MVQYSDPVNNTRPILGVKDGKGPSKALMTSLYLLH